MLFVCFKAWHCVHEVAKRFSMLADMRWHSGIFN